MGDLKEYGKGIDVLVMVQHGRVDSGKPVVKHQGRLMVCLNLKCSSSHFLRNYGKTIDQDKVTVLVAPKKKLQVSVDNVYG